MEVVMYKENAKLDKLKETLKKGYINFLPNEILLDSRLHSSSVKVYCILSMVSFADKCSCHYSQRTLSEIVGLSIKTIGRCLKELTTYNYIKKQFRLGETCIYTLVHKFAQTITNKIKDKAAKAKEFIQNKKDKKNGSNKSFPKSEKPSNFNNYPQREYDFDSLEKQLLGWSQPETTQFNETYQQALLL
jgi:DNA-binding transcriptional regulator GbsR (MarR family)